MRVLQLLLLSTVCIIHNQATHIGDIIFELDNVNGEATDGGEPIKPNKGTVSNQIEARNLQFMLHLLKRMAPVGIGDKFPIFDPLNLGFISPIQLGKDLSVCVQGVMLKGLKGCEIVINDVLDVATIPPNKLISFNMTLPPLLTQGEVVIDFKGALLTANVTVWTKQQKVGGLVQAFANVGPQRSSYQIVGVHVHHHFDHIKIALRNIKQKSGSMNMVNAKRDWPGDEIAKIVAHAVRKGVNKLLKLVYAGQLRALLDNDFILPPK